MQAERHAVEPDPPGWTRRAIAPAGVSIAHNPAWPALEGANVSYQTFGRHNGAVSVQWGDEATMAHYLAHTGLGSGGHRRVIDEDRRIDIRGLAARRVRLRVISTAHGHGIDPDGRVVGTAPSDNETIFVAVAFEIGESPVRVGYRLPASERAEFEPLLERVLGGVRPL